MIWKMFLILFYCIFSITVFGVQEEKIRAVEEKVKNKVKKIEIKQVQDGPLHKWEKRIINKVNLEESEQVKEFVNQLNHLLLNENSKELASIFSDKFSFIFSGYEPENYLHYNKEKVKQDFEQKKLLYSILFDKEQSTGLYQYMIQNIALGKETFRLSIGKSWGTENEYFLYLHGDNHYCNFRFEKYQEKGKLKWRLLNIYSSGAYEVLKDILPIYD